MIIGQFFDYKPRDGKGDHPYLLGFRVRVLSIHRPFTDENGEEEDTAFYSDKELEDAGGLQEGDWADATPWLPEEHRVSFASSDVDVRDLFDTHAMRSLL